MKGNNVPTSFDLAILFLGSEKIHPANECTKQSTKDVHNP
jgi:hypothetical protein